MPLLQILHLGTLDYGTALKLQETLVDLRKQNRIADTLLLLEHPPVITLGRNTKENNIVASPGLLKERGVETFEINRGGDVTFHGPGQLVGYPICDLRALPPKIDPESGDAKRIGAVEFVRRLEETIIRACADFGIACQRVAGHTGVWTQPSVPPSLSNAGPESPAHVQAQPDRDENERKIAAIGVHISRGVTSHGFALNVTTNLDYFKLIVPCGITGITVTSMEQEVGGRASSVGKRLEMEAVTQAITRQFGNVFGVQILWLESLASLLSSSTDPANQDTPRRTPDDLEQLEKELELSGRDDVNFSV